MDINITGNPGTGNTFMEINIQHVDNFHAFAPLNSNKGTHARPSGCAPQPNDTTDVAALRSEILAYVNRLRPCLADDWKSTYQKTWEDILDMKAVSAVVYTPGKQQGTNFNRSLVAGIIHYLHGRGAYAGSYNATRFAEHLEGDKNHSVRSALGRDPSPDVVSRLDRYFDQ